MCNKIVRNNKKKNHLYPDEKFVIIFNVFIEKRWRRLCTVVIYSDYGVFRWKISPEQRTIYIYINLDDLELDAILFNF